MQRLQRHIQRSLVEQFNQGETEGLRCPWSACPYTVHWQVSIRICNLWFLQLFRHMQGTNQPLLNSE